ncbi:MAG: ACT domain-containing protein [Coriobacteriia bacterium]
MKVRQISVFIENRVGRVSEVTGLLGENDINIRGFSVADTAEFGILRLVVDDPDRALDVLRDAGFTAREDEVICIDLPDTPGALANALRVVSDAGVNIEYIYSLVSTFVVLNVENPDRALTLLEGKPVKLASHEEIVGREA